MLGEWRGSLHEEESGTRTAVAPGLFIEKLNNVSIAVDFQQVHELILFVFFKM